MKLPYVPSADVVAALAEPAATFDTRNAELVPEVTPEWHVIEVWPGVENRIADELTLRRFGVYVPQVERKWDDRGRMVDCSPTLMFPGYIFVFVWDIDQHRSRIEYPPSKTRLRAFSICDRIASRAPASSLEAIASSTARCSSCPRRSRSRG